MKAVIRSVVALSMCLCISLPGCGGGTSSTSGSGDFTTGFEKSHLLSSLSSQQIDQMCAAGDRFIQKEFTTENICKLLTVVYLAEQTPVPSEQSCESSVQECISSLDGGETETVPCDRKALSATSCKATVAVYEQCLNELADEFDGFVERAQCSNLDASIKSDYVAVFGAVNSNTVPQTPGCVELAAQCPGLF